MGAPMKTILLLPLLGLTALALSSCTCLGVGSISCNKGGSASGANLAAGISGKSRPITAQGGTGPRHIGLVPTMETLAE